MAKIYFKLKSKQKESVSIFVRLKVGTTIDLLSNTGLKINPKDWNTTKEGKETKKTHNLPKQNNEDNKLLYISLKGLEVFLENETTKCAINGTLIDAFWLETQINIFFKRVIKTDNGLLVNHIQYIIDNANTRKIKTNGGFKIGLSKSTVKNYTLFKNIIVEYQKSIKKQIHFVDITKPFVEKFTNWLINTKTYSNNYAGKQLEILKTVSIDADKNEIEVAPYSKIIQHFREADNDRFIQTLSFDELEQIKNADFSNQEYLNTFKKENVSLCTKISLTDATLNNARNWILLGCEIGQRGGDLLNIQPENIRYNGKSIYIDIVQQKTGKSVTVGIVSPFVADMVLNNFPKKIPHQKLNDIVKVVCKLSGIVEVVKGTKLNTDTNRKELGFYSKYELIASHCFRRSFATNYYKKIPTSILINITGHSKESLFLTYINKREDKDANADLFKKFYEELHQDKKPQMKLVRSNV